jgi:membrane-bound ClpP family serine protease
LKKGDTTSDEIISNRGSFLRNTIFIFIAGFFMLLHEFLEGLGENAIDNTTYEFFELMAVLGLALFMFEWNKILKKLKSKQKTDIRQFNSSSGQSNIK